MIPSSYAFQAGQPATIDCRVMPGRLSQYYRVTWWNGNLTIATSNPHSVLPGYQLHDNFSLTINDIQLSDSSTSYRCSVIIDDPRISGTTGDFFYNRHQLGSISVAVYGKLLFCVCTDMLLYFHADISVVFTIRLMIQGIYYLRCMLPASLYRFSKYCNSIGTKGDCSRRKQSTKHHFHL